MRTVCFAVLKKIVPTSELESWLTKSGKVISVLRFFDISILLFSETADFNFSIKY